MIPPMNESSSVRPPVLEDQYRIIRNIVRQMIEVIIISPV